MRKFLTFLFGAVLALCFLGCPNTTGGANSGNGGSNSTSGKNGGGGDPFNEPVTPPETNIENLSEEDRTLLKDILTSLKEDSVYTSISEYERPNLDNAKVNFYESEWAISKDSTKHIEKTSENSSTCSLEYKSHKQIKSYIIFIQDEEKSKFFVAVKENDVFEFLKNYHYGGVFLNNIAYIECETTTDSDSFLSHNIGDKWDEENNQLTIKFIPKLCQIKNDDFSSIVQSAQVQSAQFNVITSKDIQKQLLMKESFEVKNEEGASVNIKNKTRWVIVDKHFYELTYLENDSISSQEIIQYPSIFISFYNMDYNEYVFTVKQDENKILAKTIDGTFVYSKISKNEFQITNSEYGEDWKVHLTILEGDLFDFASYYNSLK